MHEENKMSEEKIFDELIDRLKNCIALAEENSTVQVSKDGPQTASEKLQTGCDIVATFTDDAPMNKDIQSEELVFNFSRPPPDYIRIIDYEDERQMGSIMRLITKDLSEPYSIYTYRYFIHNWPSLCFLALDTRINEFVGAIVCKLDRDREERRRGYIAMLAVDESCRKLGIGTCLVEQAIANMRKMGCDEVVLETEVTNTDAMRLYSNLGFIREKRLFRYYLNGVDAFRLKLFFTPETDEYDSRFYQDFFY